MKFTLSIDCDNAAFEEFGLAEAARLLRIVADKVADIDGPPWRMTGEAPLYDINGNKCGRWEIINS